MGKRTTRHLPNPGRPGCDEVVYHATRKLEIKRASAIAWNVNKPADTNGSSWERPCASDWCTIETKMFNFFMFKATSWGHNHWLAKNSNYKESRTDSSGPHLGPRSRCHVAPQHGAPADSYSESNDIFWGEGRSRQGKDKNCTSLGTSPK